MDIAPVITPGTTAPAADATGVVSAVPTAPGQAFSELFSVALNGTDAPVPAITPATAVVTLPETLAIPNADSTAPNILTDVPVANPARIAVLGDAPPMSVTDPPESPPDTSSISWKDAQATAPNAPATRLDQPENNEEKTDTLPVDPATAVTAVSLTAQTAVVQESIVTVSKNQNSDAPSTEMNRSDEQSVDARTSETFAAEAPNIPTPNAIAQGIDNVAVATPAPVTKASAAPVTETPPATTSSVTPVTVKKTSAVVDGTPVKSRSKRGAQTEEVTEALAPETETETDSQPTESTPSLAADASVLSERVVETAGAAAPASDNVPLPKMSPETPKLAAAPDLGAVPIVTVNTVVAEPAKVVAKEVTTPTEAGDALAVGEVKAPDIKAPEAKAAEKNSDSTFAEVLVETAAEGSQKDSGTGDQKDQPSVDPTPVAPAAVRSADVDRPEAGSDRPEIDRHLVVRQVAERIENMVAARPRDGVTIHLEPRDLGTVTLVVKGLSSALDVQVSASDARVREGLEASRNDLAQALAPRGIELRDVRIVTSSSNGANSGQGSKDSGSNPNPNPDGRPRHQSPNSHQTGFTQSSTRAVRTSSSRGSRRTGGVDLLA
jgi:flagellar hook-length control protein FliK